MTRENFKAWLLKGRPILLDGATGTEFQKAGMRIGECPEKWALDNKDKVIAIQSAYVEAGSQMVYAPTFGANRFKLEDYGLAEETINYNQRLVELSKEATQGKAYVVGDLAPTGQQVYPMGNHSFEDFVTVYKEQVKGLLLGGVDLFVVETMMSLQEARAAVLAIRETCDLPIMVTLTYDENGRTLYGTDPLTALITLQHLSVDAIGFNCSTGPSKMLPLLEAISPYTKVPLIAKANAGLPKMIQGQAVYDMDAQTFAKEMKDLVLAGAHIVGGCCGSTPEYIKALKEAISDIKCAPIETISTSFISSERKTVALDILGKTHIVGERINPTGKKWLQEELKEGKLDGITKLALEQVDNGATVLDVNLGTNGIDEKEMMLKALAHLGRLVDVPLCIDSSHTGVIEAALRIYPGRALVNSISLESHKIKELLPIVAKYGSMFILLPVSDEGLPESTDKKIEVIKEVLKEASVYGLGPDDVVVDGLVTTVATNEMAARETLEVIKYCKEELKTNTILGLSNISFGLPNRKYLNSAFLAMAIGSGLSCAIANPSSELLMMTTYASDVLQGKDKDSLRYIGKSQATAEVEQGKETQEEAVHPVVEAVLKGNKEGIISLIQKALSEAYGAKDIIDTLLIPAINRVGELFDEQIYFLPQLIASAEAMKKGIEYLEPLLKINEEDDGNRPTIVLATVEGDVHDIGKNLVALMLKNYGYQVVDLGKDVSCQAIVEAAKKHKAKIIGLSALMTTTMLQMKDVISRVKEEGLESKVIIGGAVITDSYAEEIGADGYSKDAAEAVHLVKRLLDNPVIK